MDNELLEGLVMKGRSCFKSKVDVKYDILHSTLLSQRLTIQ